MFQLVQSFRNLEMKSMFPVHIPLFCSMYYEPAPPRHTLTLVLHALEWSEVTPSCDFRVHILQPRNVRFAGVMICLRRQFLVQSPALPAD